MAPIDPELARFLEGGLVALVATRDASMQPFVTRAWGTQVAADGAHVSVMVGRAASARTLIDLEDNRCAALAFGCQTTSRGVQLKGYCTRIDEPDDDDRARARDHFVAFAAAGERLGVPPHLTRSLLSADLVKITVEVRDTFDQTPGKGAGRKL